MPDRDASAPGDRNAALIDRDDERFKPRYTGPPSAPVGDHPVADGVPPERHCMVLAPPRWPGDRYPQPGRRRVKRLLTPPIGTGARDLCKFITSFSYPCGVLQDATLIVDVRFLDEPQYTLELRQPSGLGPSAAHIERSRRSKRLFAAHCRLFRPLLPRDEMEVKIHLTFGTGRPSRRHCSAYSAEPALLRDRPRFGAPDRSGPVPRADARELKR
jgi:hypothetical protein